MAFTEEEELIFRLQKIIELSSIEKEIWVKIQSERNSLLEIERENLRRIKHDALYARSNYCNEMGVKIVFETRNKGLVLKSKPEVTDKQTQTDESYEKEVLQEELEAMLAEKAELEKMLEMEKERIRLEREVEEGEKFVRIRSEINNGIKVIADLDKEIEKFEQTIASTVPSDKNFFDDEGVGCKAQNSVEHAQYGNRPLEQKGKDQQLVFPHHQVPNRGRSSAFVPKRPSKVLLSRSSLNC